MQSSKGRPAAGKTACEWAGFQKVRASGGMGSPGCEGRGGCLTSKKKKQNIILPPVGFGAERGKRGGKRAKQRRRIGVLVNSLRKMSPERGTNAMEGGTVPTYRRSLSQRTQIGLEKKKSQTTPQTMKKRPRMGAVKGKKRCFHLKGEVHHCCRREHETTKLSSGSRVPHQIPISTFLQNNRLHKKARKKAKKFLRSGGGIESR